MVGAGVAQLCLVMVADGTAVPVRTKGAGGAHRASMPGRCHSASPARGRSAPAAAPRWHGPAAVGSAAATGRVGATAAKGPRLSTTPGSDASGGGAPAVDRVRRAAGLASVAGAAAVVTGASQSASPFAEHLRSSWWFSFSFGGGATGRVGGICLTYLGLVLLGASWIALVRLALRGRATLRQLRLTLLASGLPVALGPPLFSQDAYSYVAQGELVSRGLDPYHHGPAALGRGLLLVHVAPIWRHAPAPYGPAFERLGELIVTAAGHHLIASLAGFRLVAAVSIAALAVAVPAIAEATGADRAVALAAGVANPLVLLTLLGGMHNDALMLALAVTGVAVALKGHPVLGTALCVLGGEVKAPALVAIVFIAWWAARDDTAAARLRSLVAYGAGSVAALVAISALCGLGWGWLSAGLGEGKVVSWLDPATAVGLGLHRLAGGAGGGPDPWTSATRAVALGLAAVVVLAALGRSDRSSWPRRLGGGLLALCLLGPVVWPWYESWGIVLLATGATLLDRRLRALLAALCLLGCVADFPPASALAGAPGVLSAGLCACLLAAGVALRWCLRPLPGLASAA